MLRLTTKFRRARGKAKRACLWSQQNVQSGDRAAGVDRVAKALRRCNCSARFSIVGSDFVYACKIASGHGYRVLFSWMWASRQARADKQKGQKRQREVVELDTEMREITEMGKRARRCDYLPINCGMVGCISTAYLKHFTKQGAKSIFLAIRDQL